MHSTITMHIPSPPDAIPSSIARNIPFYSSLNTHKCSQISSFSSASAQFGTQICSRQSSSVKVICELRNPGTFSLNYRPKFGSKQGLNCSRMANQFVDKGNKLDEFVEVGNKVADAAGHVIRKYFRKHFDILDKDDLSPVTIADRAAEEAMRAIISECFPSHAMYTTSPHLFSGDAEAAFTRVRNKPYDFLALIPVIEGAGGKITDWKGLELNWQPSFDGHFPGYNVIAAGDAHIHQEAMASLEWN